MFKNEACKVRKQIINLNLFVYNRIKVKSQILNFSQFYTIKHLFFKLLMRITRVCVYMHNLKKVYPQTLYVPVIQNALIIEGV